MKIIKESDFRKEIKSNPSAVYLFYGEEDYMKAYAQSTASEAISPDKSLSFFNEIKLDPVSYSPYERFIDALLDAIMPMPMMADRKLIILSNLNIDGMKQSEVDTLLSTLSMLEEYDYNTVIINVPADCLDAGTAKRPSALLKKLGECMTLVNFEKNSPARLISWLAKHFEHNGVFADSDVCSYIIERCGRDMFFLAGETDKLSHYVKSQSRDKVTLKDVEFVAIPSSEYDAFALTNAITAREKDRALGILANLKHRRVDPVIIMAEISRTVCDMSVISSLKEDGFTLSEISASTKFHEYRVSMILQKAPKTEVCKNIISRCRQADLELKSSRDGYAVIEKLICTL